MFLRRAYNTHPEFAFGVRQMLPQSLGIAAWGLMTGVAMVKSGMSIIEALAMAMFVYAGSSQLAAIPLLLVGAPMWVILATAFCVNLRFVVFSLHLRSYLIHLPRLERLVTGYLTTDITRTWPVGDKFSDTQLKFYNCIKDVRNAIIAAMKPGVTVDDLRKVGKEVYEKHGLGKYWFGYVGHFVGMAVHDVGDYSKPFVPGVVFNVEPIIEDKENDVPTSNHLQTPLKNK